MPPLVVFENQVIPAEPPLEAIVMPPDELVIVTFAPAVKFAKLNPLPPVPINNCPLVGDCDKLSANVPLVVMGLPLTDRNDGTLMSTLVTVPEPPPPAAAQLSVPPVVLTNA